MKSQASQKPTVRTGLENDRKWRDDSIDRAGTLREVWRRLRPYFLKRKVQFFWILLTVSVMAAAGRIGITIFGRAVDNGILQKDHAYILKAAAIFFALELLHSATNYFHKVLFSRMGNSILFDLRNDIIFHLQRLPPVFFDKNPSGRIVTRITSDVVSLGELFTQGLISIFSSAISLTAIIISMLLISPGMTAFVLLTAPPLLWIGFLLSEKILVVLRESKKRLAAINAFVAENINGIKVVQLNNRQAKNLRKFVKLSENYRDTSLKSVRLYALLWPTVNGFSMISVTVALYFGGVSAIEGAITTGAMVAFILHVRDFTSPLRMILEKYQLFQNSLSGAERIFGLMDEARETNPILGMNEKLRGRIDFENVKFSYGSGLGLALDDVNFSISPGQSVAVVGRTGSGKTTLIALLQRFYDTTSGRILVDGADIQSFTRQSVRQRIGVVQQDTFMFRGTIASNISLDSEDISRAQIERAAESAGLTELLKRKSGGLDSVVEERGANLSFGERQLVAFARILAFDPDILILDEATANVDSFTESLLQEATRKIRQNRTCIIIAHRLSTVVGCDLTLVLDRGRLVQKGTHQQLLNENGIYLNLCVAQLESDARLVVSPDSLTAPQVDQI
jgi:ATP-binding cassette, subfamily B, multidrug efflux pump